MTHPANVLQAALLSLWTADPGVTAALGTGEITELPGRAALPPYVVLVRHDVLAHDADLAPGWEHRVRAHIWGQGPNRAEVLVIADALIAATSNLVLQGPQLWLGLAQHVRTDCAIERKTGRAQAVLDWRFLTEPQA